MKFLEQEWRNIAYCLSLLNYNDKAIKKLNEFSKFYQDKLMDEEVFHSFTTILNKSRKFAKQEMKEALIELENKLNVNNEENNEENKENVENASGTAASTDKKTSSSSASRGRGRGGARGTTRGKGRGGKKTASTRKKVCENI